MNEKISECFQNNVILHHVFIHVHNFFYFNSFCLAGIPNVGFVTDDSCCSNCQKIL